MEDKIILKFKTKNILNFYEIEPWSVIFQDPVLKFLISMPHLKQDLNPLTLNYLGLMMTFLGQDICT